MADISFTLNGRDMKISVDGDRPLLWVLRTDIGLTGTKFGCGQSMCGACTVIINDKAVRSCVYPVRQVDGKEVITIEGLAKNGKLHPLQQAFAEHDAFQCGFCTSGMILNAYALLSRNPQPSEAEIIDAMEGNVCRCGSHVRIIKAVKSAAAVMKGGK
jgi:aerobic-type carbon monoxide dehydrogenase small subunit (CoxS/CutS family)